MTDNDMSALFLIFNRPDTAKQTFEAIRKAKPKRLFIAADGPRLDKPEEAELCNQARAVVKDIDWDCELHTLFREKNLGCREAVVSGITWFFEHVEEGIILEDDCLPDQSFFPFCTELLNKYRHDERVMHIGGNNFQSGRKTGTGSYYFSQFSYVWGWASWRRAWSHYRADIPDYPSFLSQGGLEKAFRDRNMRRYYAVLFEKMHQNRINTWDYQWLYTILKNNSLCITPNQNLVENIGFTGSGSHTSFNEFGFFKKLAVGSLYRKLREIKRQEMPFPLTHPDLVLPDYDADRHYFRTFVYFFLMRIYLVFLKYAR